jgi:hypothetical protein
VLAHRHHHARDLAWCLTLCAEEDEECSALIRVGPIDHRLDRRLRLFEAQILASHQPLDRLLEAGLSDRH